MELTRRYLAKMSLAAVTAGAGAVLGILMIVSGVGLVIAIVSTAQPALQSLTALMLIVSGLVNVRARRGVHAEQRQALARSAVATSSLILYLGVGLRDLGEPFWLHSVYLLLLTSLALRGATRRNLAA